MQNILCVATEWFSKNGGLSTFNRVFCETLAKRCNVFCYIPTFTEEELEDARSKNVHLVRPKKNIGAEGIDILHHIPLLPNSMQIHVIVGHDKTTGPYMDSLGTNFFKNAIKVLFIHTVPIEIEWFKSEQHQRNPAQIADEKERLQIKLAKNSAVVFGVGPKLYFEFLTLCAGIEKTPKILRFDPGIFKSVDKINYTFSSQIPEALIMGRLDDFPLKGVDIAAKAMNIVHKNWNVKINGIVLKPRLLIRGATIGSEKDLLDKLNDLIPGTFLKFQIRSYTDDIERINEEVRRVALLLMPSRTEGFGLVGLEAMGLGRPILISEDSGLAMLIQEIAPEESQNWVIPRELENDGIDIWAENIAVILKDRQAAAERLQKLVEIYNRKVNWENSVDYLLNEVQKIENNKQPTFETEYQEKKQIDRNSTHTDNEYKNWVIQMEAGSKLVQGFLSLSGIKRFSIARDLGLLEEGEIYEAPTIDRMSSKFIERAYQRSLLDKLWLKIFENSNDPNPFIKK